ncbi:hypothetical protein QF027_008076 [Streptomyces canus]|nr:hypothetical protein [Streptomyces canus]
MAALPSPLLSMLPSGPDLDPGVAEGGGSATITPPACGNTSGGSGRSPVARGEGPGNLTGSASPAAG